MRSEQQIHNMKDHVDKVRDSQPDDEVLDAIVDALHWALDRDVEDNVVTDYLPA